MGLIGDEILNDLQSAFGKDPKIDDGPTQMTESPFLERIWLSERGRDARRCARFVILSPC
jgi:hypothetical protein